MDCDQVFMILTRGPFPTGQPWDEEVEAHLETCAGCWRLAEALRPALEVFQEAVPPAEGRGLPGYWGDARPTAAVVAQLTRPPAIPALTAHLKRPVNPYAHLRNPVHGNRSTDTLRAVAFGATLTAALLGLAFWWWS